MFNADVISMPDKWEYPWYAVWDLALHTIPWSLVDVDFAKEQLRLLISHHYLHPSGQMPAYEWNFSDVNPPVHAWAVWTVYSYGKQLRERGDVAFLKFCFEKLSLNFTWWVNRKDVKATTCSREASSAWTTSGSSTAAARYRRAAIWSNRTAPRGWRSLRR